MPEIRFKQSDIREAIGMSESTLDRYRKKKVFKTELEVSKYGKTYMVDRFGVKAIINEWNLGRTIDPADYIKVMGKLYEKAGHINPVVNEDGLLVEPTLTPQQTNIESPMNTERIQHEPSVNIDRTYQEDTMNTDDEPTLKDEGGFIKKDSEIINKFLDELNKREEAIRVLQYELGKKDSEKQLLLEARNEDKIAAENIIKNQSEYMNDLEKCNKKFLKWPWQKTPKREDYGLNY